MTVRNSTVHIRILYILYIGICKEGRKLCSSTLPTSKFSYVLNLKYLLEIWNLIKNDRKLTSNKDGDTEQFVIELHLYFLSTRIYIFYFFLKFFFRRQDFHVVYALPSNLIHNPGVDRGITGAMETTPKVKLAWGG